MRRLALLLALVSTASAAATQADSDAQRVLCAGAAKDWAPVRLPTVGVNMAIPCSDQELNAYKNSNEQRKATDGLAGCERGGRSFLVMYLVNTPAGFFDKTVSGWKTSPVRNFQIAGHRVFRAAAFKDSETYGQQLIEIDASRAVLMWSSSKIANDADYAKLASCFFNTLHVLKS